ncbi:hypothetical protein HKX48_008443 [Thoreauomyces humboldtii]|nr:hypothetical protein HKX48_008443 [Thoreauomyces humboldtii]
MSSLHESGHSTHVVTRTSSTNTGRPLLDIRSQTARPPTPGAGQGAVDYFSLPPRSGPQPNPTSPGGVYENLVCPLCFTLPQRMKRLPCCGNRICAECAAGWVRQHPTCPFCRADLEDVVEWSVDVVGSKSDGFDSQTEVDHEHAGVLAETDPSATQVDLAEGRTSTRATSVHAMTGPDVEVIDLGDRRSSARPTSVHEMTQIGAVAGHEERERDLELGIAPQASVDTLDGGEEQADETTVDTPAPKRRRRIILPDDEESMLVLEEIPVMCPFRDKRDDDEVKCVGGCRWTGRKSVIRKHLEIDCHGILDPISGKRKIDINNLQFGGYDTHDVVQGRCREGELDTDTIIDVPAEPHGHRHREPDFALEVQDIDAIRVGFAASPVKLSVVFLLVTAAVIGLIIFTVKSSRTGSMTCPGGSNLTCD